MFSQISEQRLTRHMILPFDGASRASRTGRGAGSDDRMAGFHLPHDGEVGDDAARARARVDCTVPLHGATVCRTLFVRFFLFCGGRRRQL